MAFNGNQVPPYISITLGETVPLFAAETPAGATASQVMCRVPSTGGSDNGITFTWNFASAPAAQLLLYGSNTAPNSSGPRNGVLLLPPSTGTQPLSGAFNDKSSFAFYWAVTPSDGSGGATTVIAQR